MVTAWIAAGNRPAMSSTRARRAFDVTSTRAPESVRAWTSDEPRNSGLIGTSMALSHAAASHET